MSEIITKTSGENTQLYKYLLHMQILHRVIQYIKQGTAILLYTILQSNP